PYDRPHESARKRLGPNEKRQDAKTPADKTARIRQTSWRSWRLGVFCDLKFARFNRAPAIDRQHDAVQEILFAQKAHGTRHVLGRSGVAERNAPRNTSALLRRERFGKEHRPRRDRARSNDRRQLERQAASQHEKRRFGAAVMRVAPPRRKRRDV